MQLIESIQPSLSPISPDSGTAFCKNRSKLIRGDRAQTKIKHTNPEKIDHVALDLNHNISQSLGLIRGLNHCCSYELLRAQERCHFLNSFRDSRIAGCLGVAAKNLGNPLSLQGFLWLSSHIFSKHSCIIQSRSANNIFTRLQGTSNKGLSR